MAVKYTIPKISKTTRLWYVHYRYEGKQFREKHHYNKIEDLKERQMYFEELCKDILAQLKTGWNPNIKEERREDKSEITTNDAFDLALKIKKERLQNDTYVNLRCKVNRFKKAMEALNFKNVKIVDLKNRHYEMLLNEVSELYTLSDGSYNQYKINLSSILNVLVDEKILKRNFRLKIKSKKVIKTVAHIPANEKDMLIIKNHLLKVNNTFYYYWASMFHTGIRPTEMLRVRLSMVNIEEKSIYLPGTITKNKQPRTAPINQYLEVILNNMNLENYPQDYFLFGSANERFSRISFDNLEYVPGAVKIPRKQATTLWKEEIKDKLGIKMTLYAIKKHSANSLILAGASVGAIKDLFGHTSEVTTQIYITNLKEVNRKEILEKGTDF